jgi:hypothetical protein
MGLIQFVDFVLDHPLIGSSVRPGHGQVKMQEISAIGKHDMKGNLLSHLILWNLCWVRNSEINPLNRSRVKTFVPLNQSSISSQILNNRQQNNAWKTIIANIGESISPCAEWPTRATLTMNWRLWEGFLCQFHWKLWWLHFWARLGSCNGTRSVFLWANRRGRSRLE